jgi:hypothetical protein
MSRDTNSCQRSLLRIHNIPLLDVLLTPCPPLHPVFPATGSIVGYDLRVQALPEPFGIGFIYKKGISKGRLNEAASKRAIDAREGNTNMNVC